MRYQRTLLGALMLVLVVSARVNAQDPESAVTLLDRDRPAVGAENRGDAAAASPEEVPSGQPLRVEWLAGIDPASRGLASTANLFAAQPQEKPPQPEHTGLAALLYETVDDFKAWPQRKSTWVILGIGAGVAALAHPADKTLNARLVGSSAVERAFKPGKYIGSFPVELGAASGLYLVGRYVLPHADGEPQTNKVSHLGFDLVRATIVSEALTYGVKLAARRHRPTGECCSFPSGHAADAFAMASVLERHLGYRGAWPTLLVASYIAASRLHDNRHFVSDVVFGAALGTTAGWAVVSRHGREKYTLTPMATPDGIRVALTW